MFRVQGLGFCKYEGAGSRDFFQGSYKGSMFSRLVWGDFKFLRSAQGLGIKGLGLGISEGEGFFQGCLGGLKFRIGRSG